MAEAEHPAISNCRKTYLKLIEDHMSMDTLRNFEHRLELLRKSSFFINIVPKKILFGLQYTQTISTMLLVDPVRFKRMKEMGTDQTVMQLVLLEEYLKELKRSRAELVEMVLSNDQQFSLTKQQTLDQKLSGLKDLVDNFKYILVSGPLYIKNKLISPTTFHHLVSLRMFLNTKRPVMFDRSESMAFDNWAFLSWHVSGNRLLTDSFEVHFQQLNVQSNEDAHSGVHTVEGNTLNIDNLLPEKSYQFSIRRTKTCNLVYDEWCDIITLSTRKVSAPTAPKCIRCLQNTR